MGADICGWNPRFNLYAAAGSCFFRRMRGLSTVIVIGWGWMMSALPAGALTWEKSTQAVDVEAGAGDLVVEFPFKNEGTAPVTIKELKASCGCTTPTVAARVIPAGDKGAVKVTYSPGGRVGPQSVRVTVTTDEAGNAPIDLQLRVDIRPLVSITPRLVHWTKADGPVARTIELKRMSKEAVRVGEPVLPGDTVTVALAPGAEPDTWRLTLTPRSLDEPFTTKVEIPVAVGERTVMYSVFAVAR